MRTSAMQKEATEWLETYERLEEYIEDCQDEDELWMLARAMAADTDESGGYWAIDEGDLFDLLLEHWERTEIVPVVPQSNCKAIIKPVSGKGIADNPVRSIFRYPGGKSRKSVANKILSKRPKAFIEYREPFAGGSGIAMLIDPKIKRWINDLDERPMTVLKALRDDPEGFIDACQSIPPLAPNEQPKQPHYEWGYERLQRVFKDEVRSKLGNKAVEYYFKNRTAHSARTASDIQYFSAPDKWNIVATNRLQKASERLQGMKITIGNYLPLLMEQGEDCWCYLDAPYYSDTLRRPSSRLYAKSFEREDHKRLAEAVRNCPHKIMLSYDDHPMIRELYEDDFYIFEEDWIYSITSNASDPSRIRPPGAELIITNYSPEKMVGVEDIQPSPLAGKGDVACSTQKENRFIV